MRVFQKKGTQFRPGCTWNNHPTLWLCGDPRVMENPKPKTLGLGSQVEASLALMVSKGVQLRPAEASEAERHHQPQQNKDTPKVLRPIFLPLLLVLLLL